ncbi:phosphatase PAP2 family protein [uncultured Sunxiuqinia sp.]|uniref:phosphatase PAP2 family protein n=1 Tax=uncultured Sunxiuqinia sp. TaxID=1573825 RepID=UPI002AA8B003|nr:phosphatase PAP2 family protein [uncultured Sunxiuqinia sp.]
MAFIESIKQLDQSIFFFFNGMHNSFWDIVMSLLTKTGTWLLFYLTLIYFIVRKYKMKALVILILLALTIVISDQVSVFFKETVKRFRPTHEPAIQNLVHYVHSRGGLFGFFSSHATNSFAVAVFTARLFKNTRYQFLIYFWAILVSYTRIYLGVHYPFDILTGMLVGILIGHFIYKLLVIVENRFLLLKLPKLESTGLTNEESYIIMLVFSIFITTILLSASQLVRLQ